MREPIHLPLHDRSDGLQVDKKADPARLVPLMEKGTAALDEIDDEMGLAFDDWDKQYYYKLFVCASSARKSPVGRHTRQSGSRGAAESLLCLLLCLLLHTVC